MIPRFGSDPVATTEPVYHFRRRRSNVGQGDQPGDEVDRLLAEGRHAAAAAAARAAGQPGRARAIYERIWDFRAAAECARQAGDEAGELRNLIDARALDEADALAARLIAQGGEAA